MRMSILAIIVLVAACRSAEHNPVVGPSSHSAETQFALDQIMREIRAAESPVGVLYSSPVSVDDALTGLLAMGLGETTDDPPSVIEHEGFLLVSWRPLESPFWGQRGYAVEQQSGDVYAWSLW